MPTKSQSESVTGAMSPPPENPADGAGLTQHPRDLAAAIAAEFPRYRNRWRSLEEMAAELRVPVPPDPLAANPLLDIDEEAVFEQPEFEPPANVAVRLPETSGPAPVGRPADAPPPPTPPEAKTESKTETKESAT